MAQHDGYRLVHIQGNQVVHILGYSLVHIDGNSTLKDIDAAQNPAEVAAAIESRRMKSELFSSLRSEEIKNFCDVDITACKIKISEQLKLGRNGIFQSNVDPKIANAIIINALETVLRKSMQLTN